MSSLLNQGVSLAQGGYGLYGQLKRTLGGDTKKLHFIQGTTTLIEFDACLNESHGVTTQPSEFAIEDGQTISDHISVNPIELQLSAVKTDTPIEDRDQFLKSVVVSVANAALGPVGVLGAAGSFMGLAAQNKSPSPSQAAYAVMLRLSGAPDEKGVRQPAQIFDVVTGLQRYPSMCIKNMAVARDASTGDAIVFQLTLAQIRTVSSQTVDVVTSAQPALTGKRKLLAESFGDNDVDLARRQAALTADRQAQSTGDLGKRAVQLVHARD